MLLQTLVDTKLHWTKITSSASKLGTFSPFFCFVFFFCAKNNFIVSGVCSSSLYPSFI